MLKNAKNVTDLTLLGVLKFSRGWLLILPVEKFSFTGKIKILLWLNSPVKKKRFRIYLHIQYLYI